jgi:hypothetical protein
MKDLRKDLRQYIDLRRALGYKLRKHEPRLDEFITFLEAKWRCRIKQAGWVDEIASYCCLPSRPGFAFPRSSDSTRVTST